MTRSCASVAVGRLGGRRRIAGLLPGGEHLPVRIASPAAGPGGTRPRAAATSRSTAASGVRFSSRRARGLMRREAIAQRAADRHRRHRHARRPGGIAPPRPAQAGARERRLADEPAHERPDVRVGGASSGGCDDADQLAVRDALPRRDAELGDDAVARRGDLVLHLHRLDHADHLARRRPDRRPRRATLRTVPCIGLATAPEPLRAAGRAALPAAPPERRPRRLGRVEAHVEGAAVDLDRDDPLARLRAVRPARYVVVR